jgi:hypothetical protein
MAAAACRAWSPALATEGVGASFDVGHAPHVFTFRARPGNRLMIDADALANLPIGFLRGARDEFYEQVLSLLDVQVPPADVGRNDEGLRLRMRAAEVPELRIDPSGAASTEAIPAIKDLVLVHPDRLAQSVLLDICDELVVVRVVEERKQICQLVEV